MSTASTSESLLPYNYHLLYSIKYDKKYQEELLRYIKQFNFFNLMPDDLKNVEKSTEPVHIPLEVIREILFYLDFHSLNNATQICKHWKGIVDHGSYWNDLCLYDFNITANSFHNLSPKELYKVSLKNYHDTKKYYMNNHGYRSNFICPAQYFSALLPSHQYQLISATV